MLLGHISQFMEETRLFYMKKQSISCFRKRHISLSITKGQKSSICPKLGIAGVGSSNSDTQSESPAQNGEKTVIIIRLYFPNIR